MNKNRNRLFVLLVCALVALVVFAACEPEVNTQTKKLDRIELDTTNTQTEFTVGDEFTYQGLEVRAFYDDNTSAIVTGYTVVANRLDDDGKLTAESDEATVSYTEEGVTKTATYDITVVADTVETTKNVEGIKIIKQPNVTEYYVGETYSTEGLELEVTYDDETTDHITSGFAAPASTALAGEISVTVSYQGKTDTFTINVYNKLTGLKVEGANVYNIGDDFKGITVTALYNNKTTGGTVLDQDDYTCEIAPELTDNKLDAAGTYTVTVNYSEEKIEGRPMSVSDTFTITVIDASGSVDIQWGEEGNSMREWKYWSDTNIITISDVKLFDGDDGVNIHAAFSSTGELDWGFQLFYNDTDGYNLGSIYTLTLTIISKTDCTVVINGQRYVLTANEAKPVEVSFSYSYNGDYTGMSMFDMQVIVHAGESYDLMITDIAWEEEEVSGAIPEKYDLVFSTEDSYVANAKLLGRWVYYHTAEETGEAELGSKVNGTYDNGTLTLNFTDNVGAWWRTQLFYKNTDFQTGSRKSVKLTLLADFNGRITVNGNVYTLESGVALPVEFNFTQGAKATLSIQLGVQSDNSTAAQSGKLIISDIIFDEWNDSSTPGTGGGNTDPVEPGTVRVITINGTEPYAPGFVRILVSAEDLAYIRDNAALVKVNGEEIGGWVAGGFVIDYGIQIHYANGDTSFECEWYDASGNLIATCSFSI